MFAGSPRAILAIEGSTGGKVTSVLGLMTAFVVWIALVSVVLLFLRAAAEGESD